MDRSEVSGQQDVDRSDVSRQNVDKCGRGSDQEAVQGAWLPVNTVLGLDARHTARLHGNQGCCGSQYVVVSGFVIDAHFNKVVLCK